MTTDEFVEEAPAHVDVSLVGEAVVAPSDWTTETLLSQLKKKNIVLNPRFQRRDAWTIERKSQFVESLILGLPIPQIVLAERKEAKGTYLVLDGKQRLLSLLQFAGLAPESQSNGFRLQSLEVRDDLNGKTFADLQSDLLEIDTLTALMNQSVRSVVIRNWPSAAFLHMVFLRLNTGSVTLSSQELRQALFPGPFSDFIDDRASASKPLQRLLGLDEPDFRMRDVELLARYLAFANFLNEYAGELKMFVDDACRQLNLHWGDVESSLRVQVDAFDVAIEAGFQIFGEDFARRPPGHGKRRLFNRAILDAMLFYLSDRTIREAAIRAPKAVSAAFSELYRLDGDFVRSTETSTKTIAATADRYRLWGDALQKALQLTFNVPAIQNGRLRFSGFWG